MKTKQLILTLALTLFSAALITSCNKDKEDEMTETNNSTDNDNNDDDDNTNDDDKGTGTISVIVRMSYCNDYVGELTVEVDGETEGTLSNCNDDLSCGESGAAVLNIEVEAGTQHDVKVTSETYSSSNSLSIGKDECKLIEVG